MKHTDVTHNQHSIVFSREGSFITSVPIRRRIPRTNLNRQVTWTAVDMKPGEIVDLIRRLTITVNSERPGSLLQKIHDEMNSPYIPSVTMIKTHETRLKNFRNRSRSGRGRLTRSNGGHPARNVIRAAPGNTAMSLSS
jgi:hypothetical protein